MSGDGGRATGLHVVERVVTGPTVADRLAHLQAEYLKVAESALDNLKADLCGAAVQCAEVQHYDGVSHGEKEELRRLGEAIEASLQRIAALRARSGR